MKPLLLLAAMLFQQTLSAQSPVTINITNDYNDVYHLSLIIYTPDGKNQTRVSDLKPQQTKTYNFPIGTEIFFVDWKQEALVMKGNDIRASGIKPTLILHNSSKKVEVALSSLGNLKQTRKKSSRDL